MPPSRRVFEKSPQPLLERAPGLVGAMLTRAQICWVSRNGKPCGRSYAAHSGSRPIHSPFSTRCELNSTERYREVAQRLTNNHAVRFEKINGKEELILSPLEKLEEPASLVKLREAVVARLPRVDIPEMWLRLPPAPTLLRRLRTSRNVQHALPI